MSIFTPRRAAMAASSPRSAASIATAFAASSWRTSQCSRVMLDTLPRAFG
jgi:hypothetical protein